MENFKIGDFVARKSYGADIYFAITDIINSRSKPIFILRGLMHRIEADCNEDDLIKYRADEVYQTISREINQIKQNILNKRHLSRRFFSPVLRAKPGKILHIDSSKQLLDMCIKQYDESGLSPVTKLANENQQPEIIRDLLEKHKPDILIVTGHDGIKKNTSNLNSLSSYRNSKYFVNCVKEARKYEPSYTKLCIFAGACQSYYEAIMDAGANFASSPGRILINALDPAIVSQKVALTHYRRIVTPREISRLTISGSQGIGGINTRGHLR